MQEKLVQIKILSHKNSALFYILWIQRFFSPSIFVHERFFEDENRSDECGRMWRLDPLKLNGSVHFGHACPVRSAVFRYSVTHT